MQLFEGAEPTHVGFVEHCSLTFLSVPWQVLKNKETVCQLSACLPPNRSVSTWNSDSDSWMLSSSLRPSPRPGGWGVEQWSWAVALPVSPLHLLACLPACLPAVLFACSLAGLHASLLFSFVVFHGLLLCLALSSLAWLGQAVAVPSTLPYRVLLFVQL